MFYGFWATSTSLKGGLCSKKLAVNGYDTDWGTTAQGKKIVGEEMSEATKNRSWDALLQTICLYELSRF